MLSAVLLALVSMSAHAAWYWPFADDEDSPDAKPRLHRLLENANDLIEQAEDAALEGDAEKALELYNSALTNLVDVAAKNPDRAEKPEFAPLRNKIAATSARSPLPTLRSFRRSTTRSRTGKKSRRKSLLPRLKKPASPGKSPTASR